MSSIHNNELLDAKEETLVGIYVRVSSYRQCQNFSLDEQVRICMERCKLMNWKIRYIFRENAESAKNIDRPRFKMMLEKAKQGKFHILVFWKLDRFCRSLRDVVNIEKELNDYGISLHSVTEQIDTTTPFGRFNFRNVASAAELERDLISVRCKMGFHGMALKHLWPNNSPPYGYSRDKDGRLLINEKEAKVVKRIYKLYIQTMSMPEVQFSLNKERYKPRKGNEWTKSGIRKILTNELYAGRYTVADVDDHVEEYKIIDENIYQAVKKIRMRHRTKRRSMPPDRKNALINRMFDDYLGFLDDMEKEEEKII